MKPFAALDLTEKYILHDVPIYCHNHPTEPDGMNACVKELESTLKAFEIPDTADELSNPVDLGTLKLRDNAGVLEVSADDGVTWQPAGEFDHTALLNIGTNTHAQIDTHLADTSIHGAHPPAQVANPVSFGGSFVQLRENTNDETFEVSLDGGSTWAVPYYVGTNLDVKAVAFYPPYITSETEPTELGGSALAFWRKTSTNQLWLLYKWDETVKKIELT